MAGAAVSFAQVGEKLRITPTTPLDAGLSVPVVVTYSVDPRATLAHTAWVPTPDGFAICPQPNSARTVFPPAGRRGRLPRRRARLPGPLGDWLYGTKTPRMPGHPDWTVTPVTSSLMAPHSRRGGHWHENSATL
ncbi:hypothetical protein [Streptomyces sp. NPDC007856]|uniref:hypothetical protein n=1 Tax=Streptomyces sp. NPDC007856 TaxID=3364781 RepID=UPI00368E305A